MALDISSSNDLEDLVKISFIYYLSRRGTIHRPYKCLFLAGIPAARSAASQSSSHCAKRAICRNLQYDTINEKSVGTVQSKSRAHKVGTVLRSHRAAPENMATHWSSCVAVHCTTMGVRVMEGLYTVTPESCLGGTSLQSASPKCA